MIYITLTLMVFIVAFLFIVNIGDEELFFQKNKLSDKEIEELKEKHKLITDRIHEIANDKDTDTRLRANIISIWWNKKEEIEQKLKDNKK